ncbi:MAG: UDP-glucose 4-epimerase [Parcubacteria group bacterium]|nr:UDP-glucose 4-epimerase [Parcubacteria group bacterium]
MDTKTVSAIIACYNDGQAIPIMHERLTKVFTAIGCNYRIIFVNDGSPDDSETVLRALARADSHVTVVTHSRNFSSQNAFMSGMRIAQGDAVVLLDGDLQDPPEMIEQFVQKWNEGFDVVYGVRVKRDATLFLRIAYKLFYRIFSSLSYIRIPRDAGDFSLMDKKVVAALIAMPERDLFIRGLRAWVGFRQTGVPYHRPERMFGRTTNNVFKNIRWAKKAIFSFSYEPLELLFYTASLISLITFLAIVFYFVFYFLHPDQPKGTTTIILLILFFGSVQLLSISIIGEYLGRIFEEVKRRPHFVVKEILNAPDAPTK